MKGLRKLNVGVIIPWTSGTDMGEVALAMKPKTITGSINFTMQSVALSLPKAEALLRQQKNLVQSNKRGRVQSCQTDVFEGQI